MPKFAVYINIGYKEHIRDPEGETIQREVFERAGLNVPVRSGKCLRLIVEAQDERSAADIAVDLARRLRLGNPNVHSIEVLKVGPWK